MVVDGIVSRQRVLPWAKTNEQGSRQSVVVGRGDRRNRQELSLKSRNAEEWGKEKTRRRMGTKLVCLPTPTLYISLLLPATSSVFRFERHTACTILKRSSSVRNSRFVWEDGLLTKRTRQDARPCARRFLQPGTCPIYTGLRFARVLFNFIIVSFVINACDICRPVLVLTGCLPQWKHMYIVRHDKTPIRIRLINLKMFNLQFSPLVSNELLFIFYHFDRVLVWVVGINNI